MSTNHSTYIPMSDIRQLLQDNTLNHTETKNNKINYSHGDQLQKKGSGIFRIYYQNINGIKFTEDF